MYLLPKDFPREEFASKLVDAKNEVLQSLTNEQIEDHLKKIKLCSDLSLYIGLLIPLISNFFPLYILSSLMISFSLTINWTVLFHHSSHGGYEKFEKYNRGNYGIGLWRRLLDFPEFILPEAWNVEHNKQHHYFLSEDKDPDNISYNTRVFHGFDIPKSVKYLIISLLLVPTWKISYYASNVLKEYYLFSKKTDVYHKWPKDLKQKGPMTILSIFESYITSILTQNLDHFYWITIFAYYLVIHSLPVFVYRFLLLPLLLSLYSIQLAQTYFYILIVAEIFSNIHSFIIIAPNHAGHDMYLFTTSCKSYSEEFYLRSICSSVDYETGNFWLDMTYGYLNYQIEHHLFPNLSPLHYVKLQPKIKEICSNYNVPYVQETCLLRFHKCLRVFSGHDEMKELVSILPPPSISS